MRQNYRTISDETVNARHARARPTLAGRRRACAISRARPGSNTAEETAETPRPVRDASPQKGLSCLPLPVSGPVFPARFSSPCRWRLGRPSWWRLLGRGPCGKATTTWVGSRRIHARGSGDERGERKNRRRADATLGRQRDAQNSRAIGCCCSNSTAVVTKTCVRDDVHSVTQQRES